MSTALQINSTSSAKPHLWKPGQSGNPLGRSIRKFSTVNKVKDLLAGVHTDKYTAEKLALYIMKLIFNPKTPKTVVVQLVALIFQYTEQKPVQKVEVTDGKHQAYMDVYNWFANFRGEDGTKEPMPKDMVLSCVLKIHPDAKEICPELFTED